MADPTSHEGGSVSTSSSESGLSDNPGELKIDPPRTVPLPGGPDDVRRRGYADRKPDFTDRLDDAGQPTHKTMMEAFRYGWGNGERKLMIAGGVTTIVMSVLAFLLGAQFVGDVASSGTAPYDVDIPVKVIDRVEGVEGPATDTGRVTVSIEGCNTTQDVLLLSFSGQWVKYDEITQGQTGPTYLVPAQLVTGVAVGPGGTLCGDGSQPTVTEITLPDSVASDEGLWQISVQVEVRRCERARISNVLGSQLLTCDHPGDVLDHVGWFTEHFEVVRAGGQENGTTTTEEG